MPSVYFKEQHLISKVMSDRPHHPGELISSNISLINQNSVTGNLDCDVFKVFSIFIHIKKARKSQLQQRFIHRRKERGKEGGTKSETHLGILRFIIILFTQIYMCLHAIQSGDP